jgi:hypothetical protein
MKKVVLLPIGAHSPHLESTLAIAQSNFGNEHVIFLSCSGKGETCIYNPEGNAIVCSYCKYRTKKAISKYKGKFELKEVGFTHNTSTNFSYNTLESLKQITYKDVSIGYAALSTYISLTRQSVINFENKNVRKVIDSFLRTSISQTQFLKPFIECEEIGEILLFNGRLNNSRPMLDLAKHYDINFKALEVTGVENYVIHFDNCLPHDLKMNNHLIEELWENSSTVKAIDIATSFYHNRASAVVTNESSYVSNQKGNLLPIEWDPKSRNIVIFNSSEDEFLSIGKEYEGGLFERQIDGLRFISEFSKQDKSQTYYLRIHPNLINTQKDVLQSLHSLAHSNFIVVNEDSNISSYELLKNCDKVVIFNSSMGAESAFWGKPTILLCPTFYRDLKITYNPKSINELSNYLGGKLEPKEKLGAYKMALFWLKAGYQVEGFTRKGTKEYLFNYYKLDNILMSFIRGYASKVRRVFLQKLS